ncbi:MAG: terminase [Polaromonas sp.]|nr:terminase [Polaromonas sp.]
MTPETLSPIPSIRLVNKAAMAVFFEVSPQALDGWIRRGCPAIERGTVGKSWTFDLLAVIRWRMESSTSAAQTDPNEMSPADRRSWYYGESTKRKLQALDITLIPSADVQATIGAARELVADGLSAMPDNLERLHGISADVAGLVRNALDEALVGFDDRLRPLMWP